jgi:hypothetical protein
MKKILAVLAAAACAAGLLTAGAAEPPRPILNTPCSKLGSATSPAKFFPAVVAIRDAAHETIRGSWRQPLDYAIRQTGGLTCEWSNGVGSGGEFGDGTAWRGIRLELLPDGAASFSRYAASISLTGTETMYCFDTFGVISCYYDGLVDGDWLSMQARGLRSEVEGRALLTKFRTAVALARPSGLPAWTPPVGTVPLPDSCDDLISIDRVQIGFAARLPLVAYVSGFGSSPGSGASSRLGSANCTWLARDTFASAGSMYTLRGGAWAWAEARSRFTAPSALTPVAIPRLRTGDEAYVRCDAPHQRCYLDLIIGGNWISLAASPEDGFGLVRADRRDALIFIATQIAWRVYG